MSMKMLSRKLAMPLLGMLLWVLSIHAGTFAKATILPRPLTGLGRSGERREQRQDDFKPNDNIKITEKDLNRSVLFGNGVVNRMLRLETNLGWSDINVKKGTPSHGQLIFNLPEREALKQGREALVAAKATAHLMNTFCNKHNLSPVECSKFISSYSLAATPLDQSCTKLHRHCTQEEILSPYRSMDGSCNHKTDGVRGVSMTPYKRLLHPEYLDGVQEPRRAVSKKSLPSARTISTSLRQIGSGEKHLTQMVVLWSQFIEHDLSHTAFSKMVHTENTIECCTTNGNNLSPRYIHPFCAPISVASDDQDYSQHGLDCMTYVRSIPGFRSDCSFGPIDQVNQATHYLDASQIYGPTHKKSDTLRTFTNGELIASNSENHVYLPTSQKPLDDCQLFDADAKSACFTSGDSRVNVHPQLTALHTIWLREHNRIALQLSIFNPNWDDEILFQEARRIVIAEIQHITYNEWIPEILTRYYVRKLQRYQDYDDNVNPAVSNGFATAALRVINRLMDGKLKMYRENRLVNSTLSLRDHFNKPNVIKEPGYLDAIIRGLATQTNDKRTRNFAEDLSSQLFSNGVYGYDVFSLDIQRGRDHGLPSYTAYRTLCGLAEAHEFEDFLDVMAPETVETLSDIYGDVHDVDLMVGGLSERPYNNSLFGPTLSCIVADQFLRTRRGDRYFYTNENQPTPFSSAQLNQLEKVTLARIFCDNADDIGLMQPNVFEKIGEHNQLANCDDDSSIPKLNLRFWMQSISQYY